ncbi:MAG: hypothetical protein ACE5IH_08045 [Thermodesulfobacteriota bacterium]
MKNSEKTIQASADPKGQVERLVSSPIRDTLWQRCFWIVAKKRKQEGADKIEFADVDQLVLERSQMALPDLIKWLGY